MTFNQSMHPARALVKPAAPTPEAMAAWLLSLGRAEDDLLDSLNRIAASTGGYTNQLRRVGLLILKRDADVEPGMERWA